MNNKKFSLIFLFGTIFPVALIFLNNHLAENRSNNWSYNYRWTISELFYLVAIAACITILVINNQAIAKSKFWFFLPIVVGLLCLILFYITTSFSHFGF